MLNITTLPGKIDNIYQILPAFFVFFFYFQGFGMSHLSDPRWLLHRLGQAVSGWGSLLCQHQCATPRWQLWLFPGENSAPPQHLSRGSLCVSLNLFTFINLRNLQVFCSGVFVPAAVSLRSCCQLLFVFSLSGRCWSVRSCKHQDTRVWEEARSISPNGPQIINIILYVGCNNGNNSFDSPALERRTVLGN